MEQVVFLFDRGFRRVSLIRELRWLKQPYLIRLAVKIQVVSESDCGLLREHPLRPGALVDSGTCALTQHRPVNTRVVGMWAPGQDEPWWLATTLACPAEQVAELYDRRMGVAEALRDTKGCHFGLKLEWTAFASPKALERLFLLAAIARVVWYLAALLACRQDPSLRLVSKSKGARRSLFAIGIDAKECIPQVLERAFTRLKELWPPPLIRQFAR